MSSSDDKSREDNLMDHEYDGIQEYDNPTPGWWKIIFAGTVLWAGWYLIWYHGGGPGVSELEAYAESKAEYDQWIAEITPDVTEELLAERANDPAAVENGQKIFQTFCVACHGPKGGGKDGPNLTDGYQLHGTDRMDIYKTIRDGVLGKPMISWKDQLGVDIIDVAAYVSSLRHTNVEGGKEPQGEKVEPFE
jgi:cytochrome c oxidase cbb3-type subunit 3